MSINFKETIALECPHCNAKSQFKKVSEWSWSYPYPYVHCCFICTNCQGQVATQWSVSKSRYNEIIPNELITFFPHSGKYRPKIDLKTITKQEVQQDFKEAIECYNHGLYNACMIMARRAVQQEVMGSAGNNLYQQIESTGISDNLKKLLQKIKNFGNHGAHPDFVLFDNEDNPIEDKEKVAKLSLDFLDKYFSDMYETQALIDQAPKSQNEMNTTQPR